MRLGEPLAAAIPDAPEIPTISRRSTWLGPSIRLLPPRYCRCASAFEQSRCDRRRQSKPIRLLDSDIIAGVGMTQHADAGIAVEHALQPFRRRLLAVGNDGQAGANTATAEAMAELGWLYRNGLGTKQDDAQARAWFQKAVEAGNAQAMYRLGQLYLYGWGVAQDYGRARYWYQKAADAGNTEAKQALTRLPSE